MSVLSGGLKRSLGKGCSTPPQSRDPEVENHRVKMKACKAASSFFSLLLLTPTVILAQATGQDLQPLAGDAAPLVQ